MRARENKPEDSKDALVKGLGLLWRAARSAATGIKKEVEGTDWGKAIDDAGRELVRATQNVVNRIGSELKKVQPGDGDSEAPPNQEAKTSPKDKPKGPAPDEPGFTIANGDASSTTKDRDPPGGAAAKGKP